MKIGMALISSYKWTMFFQDWGAQRGGGNSRRGGGERREVIGHGLEIGCFVMDKEKLKSLFIR
jgi:hypothetical protein